jgi:DNA-binding SARP family transcriptional activator
VTEFKVLGPLEVADENGPLALGGQKQRALLALLLIHAGETLSVDRIVDALWGEQPPRTATTSLQNLVHQLRKLLGPEVVLTKPPGYTLRIAPDDLDLTRFERLLAEARRSTPDEGVRLLRDALALWRGAPLADLTYEQFADNEIQRLEELRIDALEQLFEAQLATGSGAELVGELDSLVARHPLRERLRGQLMLALYRSGRQAEAMDAYHDGRRRLVDELGIEPSRELQKLYGSILRQEATLDAAPSQPQLDDHYREIVKAALAGRLVVVVGPGARNGASPAADDGHLLSPDQVAAYLAECFDYPADGDRDLARVSQYVALMKGTGPLYDELHDLFDRDYEPAPVERELAALATTLRGRGSPAPLIVTASFDHSLERAFADAEEEFDTVCYIGSGRHAGKFLHVSAERAVALVDAPNTYVELVPERRTVILKIHGQVDRSPDREWESFVVSEDDYIDFLSAPELAGVVPVGLVSKLRRSHFLFLGYPLRAWHVRVLLHRLWGRERVNYRSWAIAAGPDAVECEAWRQRGIDVFDLDSDEFVRRLEDRLAREPVP